MVDLNWVQIGVGFIVGVFASYCVHDLVFPMNNNK